MQRICKNPLSRDALVNTWTTGVIQYTTDEKMSGYHKVTFENGNLLITSKKGSLGTNVSVCGEKIEELLVSAESPSLSLNTSKNIEKTAADREKLLGDLHSVLDLPVDVTLDIDWSTFADGCKESGYAERPGEIINWLLGGLRDNIARLAKDDMVKEAVQEVWTTGVIQHRRESSVAYHDVAFEDGNLVILSKPEKYGSNVSVVGQKIEDKL